MPKKNTDPERNRKRTVRRDKAIRRTGLTILGLTYEERDALRARLLYSGASDSEISSYADMLPLACAELAALRNRRSVKVRVTASGFELTAKPRKATR
jgi:hypothetical protein